MLAGLGVGGEQHPCPVGFVIFLGPCLSTHLAPHPPEALPPDRTCPTPERLAPLVLTWYVDLWSFPLQNKDCSGLPGPLPPAACLGVGRAARRLSTYSVRDTQTCVLWTLSTDHVVLGAKLTPLQEYDQDNNEKEDPHIY